MERGDDLAWGGDVVEELPEEAVAYEEDGNQKGQILKKPQIFQKPQGDWKSESGQVGVIYGVVCDCLVSVSTLTQSLTSCLTTCCRKHEVPSARPAVETTPPPNSPREKPSQTSVQVAPTSVDIFATEEADDEAIIDTGASRAVIGNERLKKLIRSLPRDLRSRVMRVPTEGVVFKFGNAGRLASSFAVMLPRAQNGWLRVEVVPGHTPFLISNAVLRGLKGIIDVEGCCLGFKGSDVWIPLTMVRKNLMGIKIVELLQKAPKVSASPTHILSAHVETTETEKITETHQMHEVLNHGRIQHDLLPKEDVVNVVQGKSSEQPSTTVSAAVVSDQTCPESGVDHLRSAEHHGQHRGDQLSGPSAHDTSRREPPGEPTARRVPSGVDTSTGHQHLDRLGTNKGSIGQTCDSHLCRSLREREGLCQSALESQSSLNMGEKLSAVLQRAPSLQPGASTSSSRSGDNRDAEFGDSPDIYGGSSGNGKGISAHCHGSEEGISVGRSSDGRRGMDQHPGADGNSSGVQESQALRASDRESHGNESQCREGGAAEGTDRHSAARVGQGDQGRTIQQGVSQGSQVHDQIQKISNKIELDLANLKCDQAYVTHEKILKSNRRYMKVVSGGKEGIDQGHHQKLHLLEIYCDEGSQLTTQMRNMGGNSLRFTVQDGDLSTEEGRNKLWSWVYMYEPEHIWVAPECKLWGNFSRYNMGKDPRSCENIQQRRDADRPHLVLCNQLYLYQMSNSRHFHLEQPRGSEMIMQAELNDVRLGTLPSTFDMCQVGKLRLPGTNQFLQKRTQVFTSCRMVFETLHDQTCHGNHDHAHIKGQFKHLGKWRNISSYAQTYTTHFARRVVEVLCWECRHPEVPLILGELVLGLDDHERPEMAQESLQLKRRRVELKQPETSLYGKAPSWKDIFRTVGYSTPRVGNACFQGSGDMVVKLIQQVVPDIKVELVVACRGTDRHRIQPADVFPEVLPWRKSVVVVRGTGEVKDLGPPENWTGLSRMRQIRSTRPAKLSLSIFGRKDDINEPFGAIFKQAGHGEKSEAEMSLPVPDTSQMDVKEPGTGSSMAQAPESVQPLSVDPKPPSVDQVMDHPRSERFAEEWAPKITPKSGPAFLRLGAGERAELRRVHNNLRHPDPQNMVKFLTERGAKPEVIAGARDMCCDTCVETQSRPKKSQPGRIHDDLDFNDNVGADGAYWTNSSGRTFHFMHCIDELTLYQVGSLSARKVEDQIQTFLNSWVQWAGPCKTLYLDPAGEYVNDAWAAMLQGEGIRVSMTAAESHWQNGRAEVHGRIVKDMLSRMERERPIETADEFTQCLRQAFAAKNSLSRVHGFTPEQCLLGKSRHLPGSLVSDAEAGSHCLAESTLPEGIRFKENLLRREQARKAFVQADNDSAFRRALLRQSRPGRIEYEAGDWVLYWRSSRGNNRLERGRWHGPAQVVAN